MFKTEMQPSAWDSPTHTHTFMLRVASSAEFSGIPFGVAIACSCFESKCPGESMEGSVCSQFDTAQLKAPAFQRNFCAGNRASGLSPCFKLRRIRDTV